MRAVSIGNGQLHSMGMAELANPLDCMHDAQAILIREREREEDNATSRNSILRILSEAYGAQTVFQWCSAILERVQQAEVLQQGLHESGIQIEAKAWNELDGNTLPCSEIVAGWVLRDMRERKECGCASQGWESAEQRLEQSPETLPELPHESTQAARHLLNMWRAGEGLGLLQQALHTFQEVRRSADGEWQKGGGCMTSVVRRLTPLE
jgi:hypothetical protein